MDVNIIEVLNDGLNYMKRASKNLNILTEAINSKDEEKIKINFLQLKEGLVWLSDVLGYFEELYDIDYSGISAYRKKSTEIIDQYKKLIHQIDESYDKKEYKQLSELVEIELPKHFRKLISLFNKIDGIVKEAMN